MHAGYISLTLAFFMTTSSYIRDYEQTDTILSKTGTREERVCHHSFFDIAMVVARRR